MKNSGFSPADLSRKTARTLWLGLHILLIVPGFLFRPLTVDTSFFSILPASSRDTALTAVDAAIRDRVNSRMQILVGASDFETARNGAGKLAAELSGVEGIETVDFETTGGDYGAVREFIHANRYRLLGEKDRRLLEDDRGSLIADQALREVFSPVSFSRLDYLESDPFLLTDRILMSYLDAAGGMNSAFSPRDGVMAVESDGGVHILVSARLAGGDISGETVPEVRGIIDRFNAGEEATEAVFTGFPFHNAESSGRARREISVISTISLLVLTVILIVTFRSGIPWAASVLMIGLGAVSSFSLTLLIFGRIHIFTLVFGTSLIGITVDYSLHFFVSRMQGGGDRGKDRVIRSILPGILLGMLTTVISYLALTLTPVPLLKQIAVFSIVGILSSFLTVVLAFPAIRTSAGARRDALVGRIEKALDGIAALSGRRRRIVMISLAAAAVLTAAGTLRLDMDNDVRGFYSMSGELARNEMRFAEIADTVSLSRYFLVLGDDEESLLEREGELGAGLNRLAEEGEIGSWIGMSRFVPSEAVQEESRRLAVDHLVPIASGLYEVLGFGPEAAESFARDGALQQGPAVGVAELMEQPFASSLENLWVGEAGGRMASLVFVFDYADQDILRSLEGDDVLWYDSVDDVSASLQKVSVRALYLVGAAYLAIFAALAFLRGPGASFRICSIPVLAGVLGCGVIGWTGTPFNLFAVFGLILSLGIGIDYTIFLNERGEGSGVTYLAVALSCLSTLLSFGALSISSFLPVADFGRMVLWGVLFSFVLAPLVMRKKA